MENGIYLIHGNNIFFFNLIKSIFLQTKPIIIGGFYRSGTSLLRRLLDSHPSISCGPEVKFFRDFYGNYLKDDLAHLRLFSSIRSLGLDDKILLNVFGKAFIQCHEIAARNAGKKRWADKNPENVLYLHQWHKLLDGNFTFIHVIRNPLDVLASLNEAGFKKTIPADFQKKIELYKQYLEQALSFIRQYPGMSFTLRYEELVMYPKKTLSSLCSKFDEPFDELMLKEFSSPDRKPGLEDHKVSNTNDVHTQSINRWEMDLNSEQIKLCHAHLGSWITELGY